MNNKIFALALSLVIFPAMVFSQTWKATTGDISFKIKNAGITVTGRFSGLVTTLSFNPDKLSDASLKGTVNVATLKTGINKRDKDLMGEKYFNEDKYKLIEITSTKIFTKGTKYSGNFSVTIKGVTKQLELPLDITVNGNDAEFKSCFIINRRDFGVGDKSMMMADNVTIYIDVKAKR
jgi:polyisoprenoid-binding protein YceI